MMGSVNQHFIDNLRRETTKGKKAREGLSNASTTAYGYQRNDQGLDNRIIDPGDVVGCAAGKIACRERLGGMLRHYYRRAA